MVGRVRRGRGGGRQDQRSGIRRRHNSRNPGGATGNPFNPRLNPGGSSAAGGGAGDRHAAGRTGSDTGGSLRIAALWRGRLRPSPGMVAVERRSMG
jgi:Asp-tRNA(Asn)/Glu-tRNA(Gln) amidotransferase A subunit family amidase